MLYIDEGEQTVLSEKNVRINNICAIIYDQIARILVEDEYSELKNFKFKLNEDHNKYLEEVINGEIHVFDWMDTNDRKKELAIVLTRHLTMSIISDLVNFLYESLNCAKKGKLTVAFSLLRKPLMDELLLLEQIFADPIEFINRFYYNGNPSHYDPSSMSLEEKQELIKKVINIINNKYFLADFIYDVRYNKSAVFGLNGISNRALHIVTSDKNYKTENQNFNFIFSAEDDIERYWDAYYSIVPYLLLYTASVIDGIIFKYISQSKQACTLRHNKKLKRIIACLILVELEDDSHEQKNVGFYDQIIGWLDFECDVCHQDINLSKYDFELFFEFDALVCPHCESVTKSSEIDFGEYLPFLRSGY